MSFAVDVADGVCRLSRPDTRFLSTGFDGGVRVADAAYNVTVPEGWGEGGFRDLRSYVRSRASAAGFAVGPDEPALLTGVDQRHARLARLEGTTVVATAGMSNPAALPVDGETEGGVTAERDSADRDRSGSDRHPPVGTVNLLVTTEYGLPPGAIANLVAVAAEAKAATLLATTGFPGTTSDALVVGSDDDGKRSEYSGSSTAVGATTRACVRDAILASLRSRYDEGELPASVDEAEHGIVTDRRAKVSAIGS